jgi:branched-chain amino acid transport system permease protein
MRVPLTIVAVAILFVVGAVAPTRLAGDFVLRLGNEGLLLGMLALSVAFLMSQAGLVALGAASIYGGTGLLFAIALGEWNLTPTTAMCVSLLIIVVYAPSWVR